MNERDILPLFLLIFPLFWWGLFTFAARIGGWAELAALYRRDEAFEGTVWRFRSGQMRKLAAYHNALTLGADRRGFLLAVSFFFFPSHPKLFIAWTDISVLRQGNGPAAVLEFRFLRTPGVFLRLPPETGEELIAVRDGKPYRAE